jgi:hypothetical protein
MDADRGTHPDPSRRPALRRRVRGATLLACVLTGLVALPASAQEFPEPTTTPTSSPFPTTSPSPAPAPPPQTVQEPASVAPDRSPDRKRRKKPRRQRRQRRHVRRGPAPLRAKAGCQPFSHTQTYITWGPALAYDEPVTVVYEASHCTKPAGTTVELSMKGTAQVYQGILAQGTPIDSRPFTVSGMWDRPENLTGWPPSWWSCGVKLARYTWDIAGVYTFTVTARWGVWSLEVTSLGTAARTVHWTHNACS